MLHTIQVQSRDPVTKYEPQLSSAMQVIMSRWRVTEATALPLFRLYTLKELSQIPPAYSSLPSVLTAKSCECGGCEEWKGPKIRLRFL